LIVPAFQICLILAFLGSLFLKINIKSESIEYRMFPLQIKRRVIEKKDIKSMVCKTSGSFSYSGLGMRKIKNGWAYVLGACDFVEIVLNDNRKIVFSTLNKSGFEAIAQELKLQQQGL
jgi:hypothetical protein